MGEYWEPILILPNQIGQNQHQGQSTVKMFVLEDTSSGLLPSVHLDLCGSALLQLNTFTAKAIGEDQSKFKISESVSILRKEKI